MVVTLAYCAAVLASILGFVFVVWPLRSLLFRKRRCLRCKLQSSLMRVPRQKSDRFLGKIINCRRYKCLSCNWTGLFRDDPSKSSSGSAPTSTDIEIPTLQEAEAQEASGL